ncbi:helix-turn-helix domain-containing protein [Treponema sp.]|jgi:AraC-like DNA-binding protein|uniref:helix-turn-helix domain-containing protein n=1 Tax=Treponema sp. TaxID=166 RepID=UPI00257A1BCA|nr:helix-turn-helix domain-containing protein [Treponema sp.]MBE6354654.1 helix-turn-helix domain-containing protein [Treponema sp.]
MGIKEELTRIEFKNREYMINHIPYDREMAFYQSIRNGDMEEMKRLFKPLCVEGFGKLSDNPLRNLKYHLIITVAFITRYCIEGGLEMESAYNLSDIYIQKIDHCSSEEGIHQIHKEMTEAYVKRMQQQKTRKVYSKPISLCIDYIYDNLHSKISLDELSEVSSLSTSYLSKLFHSEVGITIAQYITNKKIEAAKNLLIYTDNTPVDISNYLSFSSESHFISVFKKITGLTPKKFRTIHFRYNFTESE